MNTDFRFALYVFCMDFHSGQWSRLYRIGSRLRASLRDNHIAAIQGNRHKRKEAGVLQACWDEWETARKYYRELKRSKYAQDKR
jgi:hypothetical protein